MIRRYIYIEFITKKLLILCVLLICSFYSISQSEIIPDSLNNEELVLDSTIVTLDTLSTDMEFPIFYDANDSIIFDAINNRVLLYGTAVVKYDDIELTSDYISYDLSENVVSARGVMDSLGVYTGKPEFKQGGDVYNPDSMSYNFKSQKAYISNVVTKNGEFYLLAEHTKRVSEEKVFLGKTKITTCDNPNPHFHFQVNKAALIKSENGDKVVSGPVFLKFRKIPTPLAVPFGWFPNTSEKSKGIIIPAFNSTPNLGYALQGLGYYLPINDYWDTRVLADIYTRGSWALNNITTYKKRYKYSGRLNLSYSKIKTGFKELESFTKESNFFVNWTHTLDSKARPNLRFSASVNAGTSNNFRRNLNSSQNNFLTNTFSSSVTVTRSGLNLFNGAIPSTLTASARHSQNTSTEIVTFTLPQLTFQTNRVFPFKSSVTGAKSNLRKAAEGIGVTYTGNYENRASISESELRLNNINNAYDEFRSGLRNQFNASTSLKAGVVSINPSFGFSSNIYRETLRLSYDQENLEEQRDTISGIDASYSWNASVNASTKGFGTFTFRNAERIKAIRHSITPSVGFRYRPKTGEQEFGFYGEDGAATTYEPQSIGIFGTATNYANSGSLTLGLLNNLEMKVKDKEGESKKVPIIDRININTSRDFARDSLNWSNLGVSAGTRIGSKFSVNYSSAYSFYDRNETGRTINTFMVDSDGSLARLLNMGGGINLTLKGTDFKKKPVENLEKPLADADDVEEEFREEVDLGRNDFVDFSTPWSIDLRYTLKKTNLFDTEQQKDTINLTQSIVARGDITLFKKWKIGCNTNYDLKAMEWASTEISLYWDLHCWEFNMNYIPSGLRKSITLRINVKASALKDLKYDKNINLNKDEDFLY